MTDFPSSPVTELLKRAEHYVNCNAAESGADILIVELADALRSFRHAQTPADTHDATYLRGWNEGIERAAEVCEGHEWTRHATHHSPTKSCAIAIRTLSDTSTEGK